ncbi:phosphoglycerate dehydrogenase-like enzyme [Halopolyspora algeriensis]|uniref:Phosphoglycerate dehydrogenase-like enzyme n=1 Tax=Halopolyspora algeriensis TaxID=1500506 RepID=A0A368VF86_9ACTN|nr:D-isomer specific 2-hydroxyacid dehydrogenase family protein [Halopolyspora algeriensis]RCW39808.1 phosphoglycerate dehydrogenase-like enzyme [Halopolyspora algeriensis]TQM56463.1 phosphoglycerate dehydrogenase-like enzyme [Halopolyspora algeriensis]
MKIHVGPVGAPELEEAVVAAGGELSSLREASALVWYGAGPERFGEFHHSGIEWVQLPAAGIEPWLEAGALGGDAVFTSAAGAYAETVAEHALALVLAGARQLHTDARASSWQRPEGIRTVFGATVGIIGAGGIGRSLMRLLEPFGVRVLAVNRSGRQVPGAQRTIRADDAEGVGELLGSCDHVVIAAPATASTDKLIGAAELERMQSHAWLVNIARGSLVDTDALITALAEGWIAGAALDVTDPEPLPDGHPLFGEPRALISPHSANPQHLLLPALARRVRTNVARCLAGEPLEGVVDLSAGY